MKQLLLLYDELRCFYRCRIGDIGRLMVQKASDTEPGTFEVVQSYPTHSRFDLNQNMDLFIGGLPAGYTVRYHYLLLVMLYVLNTAADR